MEAATARINSASWREKYCNFHQPEPGFVRPKHRALGLGAQVFCQSLRHNNDSGTSHGNGHENGVSTGMCLFFPR